MSERPGDGCHGGPSQLLRGDCRHWPILTTCRCRVFRAGLEVAQRRTGLTRTELVSFDGCHALGLRSFVGAADGNPASGRRRCDTGPDAAASTSARSRANGRRSGAVTASFATHRGEFVARTATRSGPGAGRLDQPAAVQISLMCSLVAASGARLGPVGFRPDVPGAPAFGRSGGRAIPLS